MHRFVNNFPSPIFGRRHYVASRPLRVRRRRVERVPKRQRYTFVTVRARRYRSAHGFRRQRRRQLPVVVRGRGRQICSRGVRGAHVAGAVDAVALPPGPVLDQVRAVVGAGRGRAGAAGPEAPDVRMLRRRRL